MNLCCVIFTKIKTKFILLIWRRFAFFSCFEYIVQLDQEGRKRMNHWHQMLSSVSGSMSISGYFRYGCDITIFMTFFSYIGVRARKNF